MCAATLSAWCNPVDDLDDKVRDRDNQAVMAAVKRNPGLLQLELTRPACQKDTLLGRAAFWGNLELCKFLLAQGADVNHIGFAEDTALGKAAFMGHPRIVSLLLAHGAKIASEKSTALHAAAFGNRLDCL